MKPDGSQGNHPDMNLSQFLDFIRERMRGRSQRDFAEEMGVSPQFLCDVLLHRRTPGPKLLKGLQVEELVLYRPMRRKS
jgi:transcriptional regulator with XRE-family HTH domain